MEWLSWTQENWFSLAQTLGIAGGFLLAARSLGLESRARRAEVHLAVTAAHREIWSQMLKQPRLSSLLDACRNVEASPPTPAEERFVLLVLLHLAAVRQAVDLQVLPSWDGADRDVREFLSLPLPRAVTSSYLSRQSPEFQRYLEETAGPFPH